ADARVAGVPADPIELKLVSHGRGLRFTAPEAKGADPRTPAALILMATALIGADPLAQNKQAPVPAAAPPAPAPEQPATYFEVNLSLRDVDLAELIRNLEIKLPLPLTGRVTLQVKAGIP